jgi:hypothetical protein
MDVYMRYLMFHALGGAVGYAASRYRGFSSVVGTVIGFFFGPVFAWVLFLINGILQAREMFRCPHCQEWILSRASVCRHCGRDVMPPPAQTPGSLRLVHPQREVLSKIIGQLGTSRAPERSRRMSAD